jgi:transcription termination factor Rho
MDEVIFEEFKGTGNMELQLDRKLHERRIYPCIDVARSATRKEELLVDPEELRRLYLIRRMLNDMNPAEAITVLRDRLRKAKTNAEFLLAINVDQVRS